MSEPIKLKVPAEPKEGTPEFVSQGNLRADLTPNSVVETSSRPFADWLIHTHGLTEIKPKKAKAKEEKPNPFAESYPANFPGRDHLVASQIPFETARGLTREQLLRIPHIGEQTADAILDYQPASLAASIPLATPAAAEPATVGGNEGSAADNNQNTTDGGAE